MRGCGCLRSICGCWFFEFEAFMWRFALRLFVLPLFSAPLAGAVEVGDRVAVVRDTKLTHEGEVVDSVSPGQVLTVLAQKNNRIWVSRGRPGWIDVAAVQSLDQAEAAIQSKFNTGAGAAEYLARGNIRIAKGNTEAGLADLEKAVQYSGSPKDYLPSLGFAQLAAMKQPAAIETFTKLLTEDPKSSSALMGRGLAYFQVGQLNNAFQDLSQAIELEPKHAFPRKYAGAVLHDLGRLSDAKAMLESAVELDRFDAFTRRAMGRLLYDLGDLAAAGKQFDTAVMLEPNNIEGLTGQGVILHALGINLMAAKRAYQAAIKLSQPELENAYLWSNLGQVELELGEIDEAMKHLTQAINLDPDFNEAKTHRAYLVAEWFSDNALLIEQAKSDLKKVMASSEPKTFWDYQAVARVNAILGNHSRAHEFQKLACAEVQKSGPPRFIAIANADLNRYASTLRNSAIKR
jgi:tetratricopeptide (TPR) repeat protein